MDGEFPWFYVAMIVIAFVSWVFNRIQEATAGRRRAEEIKRRKEDGDFDIEEAEDFVFEDEDFFDETKSQPPTAPPASGEDAMRKLMEALGGTVPQAPEPPKVIQKPAPEKPPEKPAQVRMTAEERAALARLKKRNEVKAPPKRRPKSTLGDLTVSELVRDPDGIRKAVLLREILDKPRSERPWE